MEHGFAGEETARGDPIDAADKLAFLPAFEAVRVARRMQGGVGVDEFRADPIAIRSRRGAALDDFDKGRVVGDLEGLPFQGAGKTS